MYQIIIANIKGGCGKSTLALALADILKGQIIDLDPQGTIKNASLFTGRHIPLKAAREATSSYLIYDTPPYHNEELLARFSVASHVLIPCKVSIPDLLACSAVIKDLRRIDKLTSAWLIFNEVRRPYSKIYHEVKALFKKNFDDVQMAKNELSNLVGYKRLLTHPISGKAKQEIGCLVSEIGLINNNKVYKKDGRIQ